MRLEGGLEGGSWWDGRREEGGEAEREEEDVSGEVGWVGFDWILAQGLGLMEGWRDGGRERR